MTPVNFVPSGRNEVIVRVNSYQNKCPVGSVSGPRLPKPAPFYSLTQFLMTLEGLMDQDNYPQRGEEPRTFQPAKVQRNPSAQTSGAPLATFQISVFFRQNASWQGNLKWSERSLDAQFRSVLELIRLMDSALSSDSE